MARAIDVGTCFLVGAFKEDDEDVFTIGRNAFFSMPSEDFADEMLRRAGAYFITRGNNFYVVGEDALKFSVITGNQEDYRRPMARGVLNPGEACHTEEQRTTRPCNILDSLSGFFRSHGLGPTELPTWFTLRPAACSWELPW